MRQTRHKSAQTVRRYIREGELFTCNLAQECYRPLGVRTITRKIEQGTLEPLP